MSEVIGTNARISLADFAGEFHELEPWQRDLVEKIAAIPPEERDRVLVIQGSGAAPILAQLGRNGSSIIIDDPWADGEPSPEERMAALDLFRPGLKLIEADRLERRELSSAARHDPRNRAERRAQQARRRKGRR